MPLTPMAHSIAEPNNETFAVSGRATTTWSGTVTRLATITSMFRMSSSLPHARMLFFLPASAFMLKAD